MVRYLGILDVEEQHQSIPNLVVKLYCDDDTIGERCAVGWCGCPIGMITLVKEVHASYCGNKCITDVYKCRGSPKNSSRGDLGQWFMEVPNWNSTQWSQTRGESISGLPMHADNRNRANSHNKILQSNIFTLVFL
ncbi:hypothetical protein GQ457_09G011970 [Hibiscus cannabinus]